MTTPQTPRYRGVVWHKHWKRWRVRIRQDAKCYYFGYWDDPELAAWVADFARFLLSGPDTSTWHYLTGKWNFPPQTHPSLPRAGIVKRVAEYGVVPKEILKERLELFDKLCMTLAERKTPQN